MRQFVRNNQSQAVNLIWRECVAFMPTNNLHNIQSAQMAILGEFWVGAMHPALAQVHHRNRTIYHVGMPGSNVGYDMLIEKENLAIARNVSNASRESITKYVAELNFTGSATRGGKRELRANIKMQPRQRKKMNDDVVLCSNTINRSVARRGALRRSRVLISVF
eukprot:6180895-Pleurochrysis_carterae.AAC.1